MKILVLYNKKLSLFEVLKRQKKLIQDRATKYVRLTEQSLYFHLIIKTALTQQKN